MALRRLGREEGLRAAWRALWVSRLVVWTSGVVAVALWGRASGWRGFDPAGVTVPFGGAGDLLVAPAARWDAAWYLTIAADGYADPLRAAFFPLYPLLVRVVSAPAALLGAGAEGAVVAGIGISLVALLAGLWVVHRLTALELGTSTASLCVLLVALFPTGWAFSAIYSESLFLALSAGSIYAGRLGRWRLAGLLGAGAAATRSTGLLLVVPLAVLYLYGPRADRPADGDRHPARWRPRHPVRPGLAWLLAVPAGLVAYVGYLAAATEHPLAPFTTGGAWHRELTGPLGGAWEGAVAAVAGARQLLSGSRQPVLYPAGGDPFLVAVHNLGDFLFLLFAAVAIVGALRRLPAAYGLWALCCVALPLSFPVGPEPLASLPRYIAVAFPLQMWLAQWASSRRRAAAALGVSALGLAFLSAAFATWQWVA